MLVFNGNSRCFAALSMTGTHFQQPRNRRIQASIAPCLRFLKTKDRRDVHCAKHGMRAGVRLERHLGSNFFVSSVNYTWNHRHSEISSRCAVVEKPIRAGVNLGLAVAGEFLAGTRRSRQGHAVNRNRAGGHRGFVQSKAVVAVRENQAANVRHAIAVPTPSTLANIPRSERH